MKISSNKPILSVIIALTLVSTGEIYPKSAAEKAREYQRDMVNYLREVRTMVYNFPCDPFPKCKEDAVAFDKEPERITEFKAIKRIYQEGVIFFTEGNYVNAYLRFLDCQKRIEILLEDLSQRYLDRTSQMLRDSMEEKEPGRDDDISFMDITIDYGPGSRIRDNFNQNRQAPLERRRYNPRNVHFANNKFRIEKNVEKGYQQLGIARQVRIKALAVDKNLAPQQKLRPYHKRQRIEYYLGSIRMSRLAKVNAETIFNLKYPYDNYQIDNLPDQNLREMVYKGKFNETEVPEIEDTKMSWVNNPYYLPKKRHPLFNFSIPAEYRVDAADNRKLIYDEEVEIAIKFKNFKQPPAEIISADGKQKPPGGGQNAPGAPPTRQPRAPGGGAGGNP